jgi:peptide chain release factor 2
VTNENIADIKARLDNLDRFLNIDERRVKIMQDEQNTMHPDFWSDPKKAEAVMKEIKLNKFWLVDYEATLREYEDLKVMREFFEAGEPVEADLKAQYQKALDAVEKLEFKSTLDRPEDSFGAILEINAGAGGTESCDWASILLRMYVMWAEKHGFKITEAESQVFARYLWRSKESLHTVSSRERTVYIVSSAYHHTMLRVRDRHHLLQYLSVLSWMIP